MNTLFDIFVAITVGIAGEQIGKAIDKPAIPVVQYGSFEILFGNHTQSIGEM